MLKKLERSGAALVTEYFKVFLQPCLTAPCWPDFAVTSQRDEKGAGGDVSSELPTSACL